MYRISDICTKCTKGASRGPPPPTRLARSPRPRFARHAVSPQSSRMRLRALDTKAHSAASQTAQRCSRRCGFGFPKKIVIRCFMFCDVKRPHKELASSGARAENSAPRFLGKEPAGARGACLLRAAARSLGSEPQPEISRAALVLCCCRLSRGGARRWRARWEALADALEE